MLNRYEGFRSSRSGTRFIRLYLWGGGILMTLAALLILPLTQTLSEVSPDRMFREISTANIAPPEPPPPEPPPPPEEEQQDEVEDIEQPPPPMNISQLEASLNPGIGGALAGAFDLGSWGVMPDTAAELGIFSIEDLDRRPRRTRTVMPNYPLELQAEGVEGVVRLIVLIDEQGNVTVEGVESSDHPALVQLARQAVSRWRFDPPMRGGQPVRARYIQPIPFQRGN